MVPEDWELVRPDSSSTVGSVRGGMVVIPSSPARSTPRHQGDRSNSLHRCVQFGLGSPVRLTLDTGTVVSISRIMQAVIYAVWDLIWGPKWCDWCATTQWRWRTSRTRRGHQIAHFDTDEHMAAQVVRQQGNYVDSRPSARSAQHPGGFPVQSRPDTDHGVDDGHGESTTHVCQVGRTTDRLVCDIRQQTTRQVRIAVSGPQGRVDRCHVHALGQGGGPSVRLPAMQDGPSSSAEDRSVTWSGGDFDRSTATGSIMVPRVDGPIPRRSDPAVRRRSRPADARCLDGRRGDPRLVTSDRQIYTRGNSPGHPESEGSFQGSCQHDVKPTGIFTTSVWISLVKILAFCRTKRWHVFRVRSHHFSIYMMHLFRDRLLPSTIISHHTSVAFVLRYWVYDPATSTYWSGLSGWNVRCNAESCLSGTFICFFVFTETTVYISKWGRWGILRLRHSPKMADAEMCVPVSIGFGKMALVPTRIGYSPWQMYVRERKHSTSTCGISTSGTWLPGEESATDTGPWMDHGTWDCPLESDGTGENAMSREAVEALHAGLWKNPGGLSAHVYTLEQQHQRYHEEPHKPMDRGDCQGSLHSSWSSVRPCDSAWGPSAFSFMGIQLSGGFTWHPVSGILGVIWGLPEFVPVRHGLYCWGHVNTGSSGGCTTRSGSRASSPTSIAYTICMQPLLRRS